VDIVINNAGILRDTSFSKMKDSDWDIIFRVHVYGAYKVTKAAWPHMMKQKYGRIIHTTSAAGIYGNFGQSNYSAAKLALLGFSNTLAREGKKSNIFSNTIAPLAGSRLTETVMPPDLVAALKAEFVSPVVAFLCHESCNESGSLFELGAGFVSKLRWQRTKGTFFPVDVPLTIENVNSKWDDICDFTDAMNPQSTQDALQAAITNLTNVAASGISGNSTAGSALAVEGFESSAVFEQIAAGLQADPAAAKQVNATFQFNLTNTQGKEQQWTVDLRASPPAVSLGKAKKADCTLILKDKDYMDLVGGTLNAQKAFMSGKLKISGNMQYAMKMESVFKSARPKM